MPAPIQAYVWDFTPTERNYRDVPERLCLGCRCRISRYNNDEYCWPCSSRLAAPLPATPYVSHPYRAPTYTPRPTKHQRFKVALKQLSGDFLAADVARLIKAPITAASQHLLRAEREGLVIRAGTAEGANQYGNTVTVWRRVGA